MAGDPNNERLQQLIMQAVEPGWDSLMDALPWGASVHARDGSVERVNRKLAEMYGLEPKEMIGMTCAQLFHGDLANCSHEQVIATGRAVQTDITWNDGRTLRITIDPILADGQLTGFLRVVTDISEQTQTKDALVRAERFATLGRMISGIAHDVGTPLSIISGYSEYLLMRTAPGGPGHKELSTILNQTRRIADFIRQLLDLGRPAQGRNDAIGLKSFLEEVVELLGHHLRKGGVRAEIVHTNQPPLIYGDSPRLRQALSNLLLNAIQQIGNGGILRILSEESPEGGSAQILLFASELDGQSHDFSKSLRGFIDAESDPSPLGLGLALTREIFDEFEAVVRAVDHNQRGPALLIGLPVTRAGSRS